MKSSFSVKDTAKISLTIYLIPANSADPDKMLHHAALQLVLPVCQSTLLGCLVFKGLTGDAKYKHLCLFSNPVDLFLCLSDMLLYTCN